MRALLKIEHSHLLRGLYRSSASWLLRMRGNQTYSGSLLYHGRGAVLSEPGLCVHFRAER